MQRDPDAQVSYEIVSEEGPDHDKRFVAAVLINQLPQNTGSGKTKKEAEQSAAFHALVQLGQIDE